jgi:hypothetical protein
MTKMINKVFKVTSEGCITDAYINIVKSEKPFRWWRALVIQAPVGWGKIFSIRIKVSKWKIKFQILIWKTLDSFLVQYGWHLEDMKADLLIRMEEHYKCQVIRWRTMEPDLWDILPLEIKASYVIDYLQFKLLQRL